MKYMIILAAAALTLSACGSATDRAHELRGEVAAAIDEQALAKAVGSAVDEKAIQDVVHGAVDSAVSDAVREALPTAEIAAVKAVIDEEALTKGVDEAINGQALKSAVRDAVGEAAERSSSAE